MTLVFEFDSSGDGVVDRNRNTEEGGGAYKGRC